MTARLLFAVAVSGLAFDSAAAQSPGVPPAPFPPAPIMTVAAAPMSDMGRSRRFGRRTRVSAPMTTMVAPATAVPMSMPVGPIVMPPVGSTAAVTEGLVQTSASEPLPTAPPMAMPGDPKAAPTAGGATTNLVLTPPTTVVPPATVPVMTASEAPMASTERSRARRGLFGRLRR